VLRSSHNCCSRRPLCYRLMSLARKDSSAQDSLECILTLVSVIGLPLSSHSLHNGNTISSLGDTMYFNEEPQLSLCPTHENLSIPESRRSNKEVTALINRAKMITLS